MNDRRVQFFAVLFLSLLLLIFGVLVGIWSSLQPGEHDFEIDGASLEAQIIGVSEGFKSEFASYSFEQYSRLVGKTISSSDDLKVYLESEGFDFEVEVIEPSEIEEIFGDVEHLGIEAELIESFEGEFLFGEREGECSYDSIFEKELCRKETVEFNPGINQIFVSAIYEAEEE